MIAVVPLLVAKYSLENHAEMRAREEVRAAAARFIERAEQALGDGVSTLQALTNDGSVTCLPEHRIAMSQAVRKSAFIQGIGLVDANGVPMCSTPERTLSGDAIMPVYRENSAVVGLGLLDQSFAGVHVAVVSWHVGNGIRLIAEIAAPAISIDPGPDYLRAHRRVEVRLSRDVIWLTMGGESAMPSGERMITELQRSKRYPIEATVVVPVSASIPLVSDLKMIAAVAAGGFAVLFIAVALWMSWRPDQAAEDEFIAAISKGEFIPYYQPVMDIDTGGLIGCEVLIRWRRPDGTIVSPGQFMTYAETSGHIFEMTRIMMRKTCEEVGDLYSRNPDMKLSVNLFAGHFDDREIIDDIIDIYGPSQIRYQQIVVEVTERQPLKNLETARKIIAEMQALGLRVALDDVGTGHGGLAYLQKLGIDIIKIDKMFIDTLGGDDSTSTIVDTLVELAGNLGMGIIAEGVEQIEQIHCLRELGVSAAQGYIFAPPLPGNLYIELAEALSAGKNRALAAESRKALGASVGDFFGGLGEDEPEENEDRDATAA
ncbi:EAL domain-containing protein [Breoghania sp. L-A4]|nr:EAL domain-containing protein [Breoghania sp. L-A4]